MLDLIRLVLIAQGLRKAAAPRNPVHVEGLGDGEYVGIAHEHGPGMHHVRINGRARVVHESALRAPQAPQQARAAQEAATRERVRPPTTPTPRIHKPAPSLSSLVSAAGGYAGPRGLARPTEFDATVDDHRPLPPGSARYFKSLIEALDLMKARIGPKPPKPGPNAKAQKQAMPHEQSKGRMLSYLRQIGFRAYAGRADRFGVGKDQRELTYSDMRGSPGHEAGHALMTPEGRSLREHQAMVGQVSSKVALPQPERVQEENAAFLMEPMLARRAGARSPDMDIKARFPQFRDHMGTFQGHWQRTPDEMRDANARAHKELGAFEEGRKTIDPKGNVSGPVSIDGKINTSAAAGGGTGPLLQRLQAMRARKR